MTAKNDLSMEDAPRRERRGLVGPILLIAIGVFFLLSNMGLVTWSFWEVAWRLWPIALIAVGLDLLVGRRSIWASLLIALITLALLFGGFLWLGALDRAPGAFTDHVEQSLSGASAAEVFIDFGVGRLQLDALPADSPELIIGDVNRPAREMRVAQSFDVEGDVAQYELRMEGTAGPFTFIGRPGEDWLWDLALSPDVPMDLTISTGAGESELDLSRLMLGDLNVDSGVGQTTVILPGEGQLHAKISGGVGQVIVEIPDGIAARIETDTGLGGTEIPAEFERQGDVYVTPGYESALDRINLELSTGVGQVSVRTYGGR